MRLIVRWLATALALFAAARIVPGITVDSDAWTIYVAMALVLGLVNALVRPILKLLSCPLILMSLGLFVFVVNAVSFWLASAVAQRVGIGFEVDGFVSALLGSLLVSIVSTIVLVVLPDEK